MAGMMTVGWGVVVRSEMCRWINDWVDDEVGFGQQMFGEIQLGGSSSSNEVRYGRATARYEEDSG